MGNVRGSTHAKEALDMMRVIIASVSPARVANTKSAGDRGSDGTICNCCRKTSPRQVLELRVKAGLATVMRSEGRPSRSANLNANMWR
mmetsp:Transcript_86329/g.240323  ORF Transcript_86329/g.240323 Transcript_86329/m.240323 type:complete len:88 (+) Transcript_86329:484-747(+)